MRIIEVAFIKLPNQAVVNGTNLGDELVMIDELPGSLAEVSKVSAFCKISIEEILKIL